MVVRNRSAKPNARVLCERRANVRECPRVPARDSRLQLRHKKGPFAGAFPKPSDGLEPSTPSLPWVRCGKWWQHSAEEMRVCELLDGVLHWFSCHLLQPLCSTSAPRSSGIKSPTGLAAVGFVSEKHAATRRIGCCIEQQRIAACGDSPVLPAVSRDAQRASSEVRVQRRNRYTVHRISRCGTRPRRRSDRQVACSSGRVARGRQVHRSPRSSRGCGRLAELGALLRSRLADGRPRRVCVLRVSSTPCENGPVGP